MLRISYYRPSRVRGVVARFSQFSTVAAEEAGNVSVSVESNKTSTPRHTRTKQNFGTVGIHDAINLIKLHSWAKFDETIELSLNMGLDPRKPNQSVKGVAKLPFGTGKVIRVCVFAEGEAAQNAKDAGADLVGGEDILDEIQAGNINFEKCIATPTMMPLVGKVGRILGPRGLMPNPKLGTVTTDTARAVKDAKAGAITFKVEKKGVIHAGIGKKSFSDEELLENIRAFMVAVVDAKPDALKGKYLREVYLSSTMGPGIRVELPNVDPGNGKFMLNLNEL